MTVSKFLDEQNWVLLKSGMCVFQVQQGEVLAFIGDNEPTNEDSVSAYIIGDFFKYTGNQNVYVKARGRAKIVYDDSYGG